VKDPIAVIDNFTNPEEQKFFKKSLVEPKTQFLLNENTIDEAYQSGYKGRPLEIDSPQFVLPVYHEKSPPAIRNPLLFSNIYILLDRINLSNYFIDRIKFNITFPFPQATSKNYMPIHTDGGEYFKSIIYYVNDCDGDTLFFEDNIACPYPKIIDRVSPKQGRAVIFDSKTPHAGCNPINSTSRQILNIVLYKYRMNKEKANGSKWVKSNN